MPWQAISTAPGRLVAAVAAGWAAAAPLIAAAAQPPIRVGYTTLRTDLPGGRHANVRTMRATIVKTDGSDQREIGRKLADNPDAWTQFAGWSPDGKLAIVSRGWESPANAAW